MLATPCGNILLPRHISTKCPIRPGKRPCGYSCQAPHKAQGQTLCRVGCYLPEPVFSHGQLYVALGRATTSATVRVLIEETDCQGRLLSDEGLSKEGTYTLNVVWPEALLKSASRATQQTTTPTCGPAYTPRHNPTSLNPLAASPQEGGHDTLPTSTTSTPPSEAGIISGGSTSKRIRLRSKIKVQEEAVAPCMLNLYFERQTAARCGLHALNNALGERLFTLEDLSQATDQVMFEQSIPPNENVPILLPPRREDHELPSGWYSEQVLAKALESTGRFAFQSQTLSEPAYMSALIASPEVVGALVHMHGSHWAALRYVRGTVIFLDSQTAPRSLGAVDSLLYRSFLDTHAYTFPIRRF